MEMINSCITKYNCPKTMKFLTAVGGLYLAKQMLSFLCWCSKNLLPLPNNLKKKYGDGWVIITGGNGNIGKALAEEFLKQSFKVLLIARDEKKLGETQAELKTKYPDQNVKYITYEFNKIYTDNEIESLKQSIFEITGNNISVLVNNVGVITRGMLPDIANDKINEMINVDLVSVTFMTKVFINLIENREGKSLVVISGSIAGRMRQPGRTIYSASKAYLEAFLECLQREYPKKIDCTYLDIGPVVSKMSTGFKVWSMVEANNFASSAMKRIGKYRFTTGHIKHELFNVMYWNVPFMKTLLNSSFALNNIKPVEPLVEPAKEEVKEEEKKEDNKN